MKKTAAKRNPREFIGSLINPLWGFDGYQAGSRPGQPAGPSRRSSTKEGIPSYRTEPRGNILEV